jgi:hypothetical protein
VVVLAAVMLVVTPLLAFGGSVAGHLLSRRSALELDRWRKREETLRILRWAIELAVDDNESRARAGETTLSALLGSALLDPDDADLVARVTDSVARGTMDA